MKILETFAFVLKVGSSQKKKKKYSKFQKVASTEIDVTFERRLAPWEKNTPHVANMQDYLLQPPRHAKKSRK